MGPLVEHAKFDQMGHIDNHVKKDPPKHRLESWQETVRDKPDQNNKLSRMEDLETDKIRAVTLLEDLFMITKHRVHIKDSKSSELKKLQVMIQVNQDIG